MLTHKQKVRLARKMRTPPEIHQQLQAILKTQQSLANRAIEIDDLSPSGNMLSAPFFLDLREVIGVLSSAQPELMLDAPC